MLVDDHEIVRAGLGALLGAVEDMEVVAQAASAVEAVAKHRLYQPDVVVMDVRMPGGSGIAACREIAGGSRPNKVVLLTAFADKETQAAAVMAGAKAFILKKMGVEELATAIRRVHQGETLLDVAVAENQAEPVLLAAFNQQEQRILRLVAAGRTNREIADEIFLSEKTVRNYVSVILAKLAMKHRSQVAGYVNRELFPE